MCLDSEYDVTWVFTIQGTRFLRNMVCAVVGTSRCAASRLFDGFRRVIERRPLQLQTSVPGNAPFLVDVTYPEELFISS